MSDEYEIPVGDTGHEAGTFLMTLTALKPFTLYETTKGWTREKPEDGSLVEAYNKIEWVFADDEGEFGNGTTSTARSERSTLYAWATGLGMAPAIVLDRSKPIPASQLIGRDAMVTFAPDKNGYSRIVSVVPAPKARTPRPAAPVDQPMTTLPNMAQPGEFDGAPAPQPMAVGAAEDPLGF